MFSLIEQRSRSERGESEIAALSAACGLSFPVTEVLVSRGYDTYEAIEHFLCPSVRDLHDPFLLSGMRELAERLRQAIDNGETVVVYGDYDADGICATAILTEYLVSRGVKVYPYIPSRKHDGYGITLAALERLIEDCFPDLILTCDCGISAYAEIEAVADSGVDFAVTDHHEVPKRIPDCTVVNPKLDGQAYPFDSLCGAGVAFKVVQALEGVEGALDYIDLATIATIADLVPLTGENRAIVTMGLRAINEGRERHPGLRALLEGLGDVSATDIAYRVAPRINAAGRMGDAKRAFNLLVSRNRIEIAAIAAEIDADNTRRKEMCRKVYEDAVELIRASDISDAYCFVLTHPDWEKGLTSIVAAQIAGEYKRPAFLLVANGDNMKGTARSVDGINIYEVLSACEDLLVEYGGHSQAAGFSILPENVSAFRARVNAYLREHYDITYFLPRSVYDAVLDADGMRFELARELARLEPYGNGNPRPVFRIAVRDPRAETMRGKPQHLVIKTERAHVNAFGWGRCYNLLHGLGLFDLNVELSVNRYNNRDYLSAILRDFDFRGIEPDGATEALIRDSDLYALAYADRHYATHSIDWTGISEMLQRRRTGVLLVAYRLDTYREAVDRLGLDRVWHSLFTRETSANYNRIVLAPTPDFDAFGYSEIVLLDSGFDETLLPFAADGARVYSRSAGDSARLFGLKTDRATFVSYFSAFRKGGAGNNLAEYISSYNGLDYRQAVACYCVFASLGILGYGDGIVIEPGVKRDLAESAAYRRLEESV